jgi:CBS domain-containing membrane protein
MECLGASALLIFALAQSYMAQLWAVIVANTLPALIGSSIVQLIKFRCVQKTIKSKSK